MKTLGWREWATLPAIRVPALRVLLAVIAGALAIGQLEVETQLLTIVIGVLVTAAGIAAALAFGLGAREVAGNLLAGAYLRDTYPVGTHIATGECEGTVKSVDALGTVLAVGDDSEVVVPNMTLVRSAVRVSLPEPEADQDELGEI